MVMPRDRELEPTAWMERFFPTRTQNPAERVALAHDEKRVALAHDEKDALLAFVAEDEGPTTAPLPLIEPAPEKAVARTPRVWSEAQGRPLWLLAAAAIAIAAIGVSSAGLIRARQESAAPPDIRPGRVSINTRPEGAEILIDGRREGTTPLAVSVAPGSHSLTVRINGAERAVPLTVAPGSESTQYLEVGTAGVAPRTVGRIAVSSDPPGARVTIDGRSYGNAPVTASDLSPAEHKVSVTSGAGSADRVVTVEPGGTTSVVFSLRQPPEASLRQPPATSLRQPPEASLRQPPAASLRQPPEASLRQPPAASLRQPPAAGDGWLVVAAPFELQVLERDKIIASSISNRIVLAAGRHNLSLINRTLGYQETRTVDVSTGRLTTIPIVAPKAALSLNARPWANVWIDETDAGQTPIANLLVPIGSHQVTFRHPQLGERRQTIVVTTTGPNRATADLTK
jgi:hypothetical protein